MTDTFRALCAELAEELHEHTCLYEGHESELVARARAALAEADGPAVPDSREPASVATQPTDEELLATLNQAVADFPPRHPEAEAMNAVEYPLALELRKARAVLNRYGHQPAPPAEGEVGVLVNMLKGIAYWRRHGKPGKGDPSSFDIRQADRLTRAADLLSQRHPTPVAVSERLPGPEDCISNPRNGQGEWCWGWVQHDPLPYSGRWRMMRREWVADDAVAWLPAHALPTPEATND